MSYIGRPLQGANLAVMSSVGDGSDTTPIATLDYATTTNGIAVYLDGVRQLAGTDFNVTAQTTLTFTTAPANGVGIDVYFLGLELSIPTPADASVTAAKLASDAVTTAKILNNAVDETKLKDALIGDFTEVTVQASDSFLLGDADGTTKRDTIQGILDLVPAGLSVKVGNVTRNITAASGNQAVTGVGFVPKAVIFLAVAGGTARASWGVDAGSGNTGLVYDFNSGAANTFAGQSTSSLQLYEGGTGRQSGEITSLDSDGFTIAWVKTSSPSAGTIEIAFLAIS